MKLLTLNIHGRLKDAGVRHVAQAIQAERPLVVALQEVCQPVSDQPAALAKCPGYVPAQREIPLRVGNPAAHLVRRLYAAGIACSWTYLPVKIGQGLYDEGLALLAPQGQIVAVSAHCISRTQDYADWRRRSVLQARLAGRPDWFCCVHMGWWRDEQEPFRAQWEVMRPLLRVHEAAPVWLLGDFNAPAEKRGEGYDLMASDGWYDAFHLAYRRVGAATIPGAVDGWRDVPEAGWRIDQVWCSRAVGIAECRVIFDGRDYPVVSDHAGVLVHTAGE